MDIHEGITYQVVKKFKAPAGCATAGKECRQVLYIGGWGECDSFLCDVFTKPISGRMTMDSDDGTLIVTRRLDGAELYRLCVEDIPDHINAKEIKEFRLNHLKECYTTFCKMVSDGDVTTVEAGEMHKAVDELMELIAEIRSGA